MTLANDRQQRQSWVRRAHQVVQQIEDLRTEIEDAIQQGPPKRVTTALDNASAHVMVATFALRAAARFMESI